MEQQQRQLAAQKLRLEEELHLSGQPPPEVKKEPELPVWRHEEDGMTRRAIDPVPSRKRNLGRQRQRDMMLLLIYILIFLLVVILVVWVAFVRNSAPNNGV